MSVRFLSDLSRSDVTRVPSKQIGFSATALSTTSATTAVDGKDPVRALHFLYVGLAVTAVVLLSFVAVGVAFKRRLRAERKSKARRL